MSHTLSFTAISHTTTLDRLLGEEARLDRREPVFINRFIQAEFLSLRSGQFSMPEEEGRLYVYPIEDGVYFLHLLYTDRESGSDTLRLCWVRLLPEFFGMFDPNTILEHMPFRLDQTAELQFTVCNQAKSLINQMRQLQSFTPLLQSLQLTEITIQLFRRALEAVIIPFSVCPVPACRFLAHDTEREKIFKARQILEETMDSPLTIKELSRKVAMNECYLKKGFKTLTGKTINEYQQELRITRAKQLLQQGGVSVTEVAALLGYSSISHFSTAFKKATGLKPCELLG